MNLRVKGLAQLKLRYELDRGKYFFFNDYRTNCTMYSGRNYTILNVLWQSKGHVNAKYGHVKKTSYFNGPQGPYGRERVKV